MNISKEKDSNRSTSLRALQTPELKLNEKNLTNINYHNKKLKNLSNHNNSLPFQKIKTPTKIQQQNKNRRSFTPCNLNQTLLSPEVSPIKNNSIKSINNTSITSMQNDSNNNNNNSSLCNVSYINSTFFEDSIIFASPSFMDDKFNDMKNSSISSLMLPPKKTKIRRTIGYPNDNNNSLNNLNNSIKYHSNNMKKSPFSSKSLKFTSTPSDITEQSIYYDAISFELDINDNYINTNINNDIDENINDSFNLNELQLTPKTSLNKCITVSSVLIGMGLQKYIKNFQKKNITYDSFMNLNNSDLIKYGIENENDRNNLLKLINFEMESPC